MAIKGINKVILKGNLGQDPELRYMPNGNAIAKITVATSDSWRDQQGQQQERTEWHRVVLYGKLAEISGQYLQKGSQVYLEGKIQTRKWKDQSGQDRYSTEVIVDQTGTMQMLSSKTGGGAPSMSQTHKPASKLDMPEKRTDQVKMPALHSGKFASVTSTPLNQEWDDDIPFSG